MSSGDGAERAWRTINAAAPIRLCDNGGWTDTWFAEYGAIFNIAVYPYAEVQIECFPRSEAREQIVIHAENYGARFAVDPTATAWGPHPLLEATIRRLPPPDDLSLRATIYSEAPAGASTGTSAAVTVALLGALDRLTPGRMTAHELAYAAHAVETEMLGQQSGIQDQLASAFGGINYIEMFAYPRATLSPIRVPDEIWWELERRLVLIYLGNSHDSSQVHERVIRGLEDAGPEHPALNALRRTAGPSRDAIYAGDFDALGRAMIANTEAQARLHPALVSDDARRVIEIARDHGAVGWKVNGAGGEGGTLTILGGASAHATRAMVRTIEAEQVGFRHIPTYLARQGLRVWEPPGRE